MSNILITYAPLVAAFISLATSLVVARIGYKNSQSLETKKVKASYLNFAFQKILGEYEKANPSITLPEPNTASLIKEMELKFENSVSCIRNAKPFLEQEELKKLKTLEDERQAILRDQYNAKLQKKEVPFNSADKYSQLLIDYVNYADEVLKKKATILRMELEQGLS